MLRWVAMRTRWIAITWTVPFSWKAKLITESWKWRVPLSVMEYAKWLCQQLVIYWMLWWYQQAIVTQKCFIETWVMWLECISLGSREQLSVFMLGVCSCCHVGSVFMLPCWECVRVAVLTVCSCCRVESVFVLPCWECVCAAMLGVCLCCHARSVFYHADSTRDLLWWDLALLILAQNTRYKTTL